MPAPKISPRCTSIDALSEPFRTVARRFYESCVVNQLPVQVYETLRAVDRQRWYFDKGRSRANSIDSSPHCWGLAIDVVLDPRHLAWARRGVRPLRSYDGGGAEWDTGYEFRAGTRDLVLVRPGVAAVWRLVGDLAQGHGLEWGGVNEGPWASRMPGYEFGWDCAHFQQRAWKALLPSLPRPT